jgi:hypothetical protein
LIDILLALFYALSGLFMKISDDAHDRKNNKFLGVVAAVICGVSIGYLAVTNADAAVIFLGILIGTLAAWKVDCLNHIISLLIFLGIILIIGFPSIGILTLIVCAGAAFLDEMGNDSKWVARNNILYNFFQYRFTLKIIILLFAVLGLFQTLIPFQIQGLQFLSFYTFIFFCLFEISYEVVGLKFDAIYDGFESLLRIIRSVDGSTND